MNYDSVIALPESGLEPSSLKNLESQKLHQDFESIGTSERQGGPH
jgi:hypothetical protein